MAIGPVQLIVIGFRDPEFRGRIAAELERLSATGAVRVLDSLAVYKDAAGEIEVAHLSTICTDEAEEVGTLVGGLIGLEVEGAAGFVTDAAAAAGGAEPPSDEEGWDVVEEIPNGTAAALLLIEHQWATPLREAVRRAGGFHIGDGFISPLDLAGIGLMTAREAEALHAMETANPALAGRREH